MFAEGVEEAVEVVFAGEGIDHGDPQGAHAVEVGGDDVELAGFDEPAAEFELEPAEPFGWRVAKGLGDVAEDDDVALGFVKGLEIGGGHELLVESAAEVEGHVD